MNENEIIDGLVCLFCNEAEQLAVYWLPDSEPKVCHVACCQCGGSGPWEESTATAIAHYDATWQLIRQLTEALGELAEHAAACELTMKADGSIPMDADDSRSLKKARTALTAARECQATGGKVEE